MFEQNDVTGDFPPSFVDCQYKSKLRNYVQPSSGSEFQPD
jgi:hypothetical protein